MHKSKILFHRQYKKFYPKFTLSASNHITTSNSITLKEDDFELGEKMEQPVSLSQPVLLSLVEEPPIKQTSFCKH